MNGGYYRIDLNENLSVIAINTLMYNSRADEDFQSLGDQYEDQFSWLISQFNNSEADRKFIITEHMYIGAKFENNQAVNLLKCQYNRRLISILKLYHEKVILEVSGHDHVADLRFNLGGDIDMRCPGDSQVSFI